MFYSIRHITKFRYSAPVRESVMEVRMHPRTELSQRCLSFQLSVSPRSRMHTYRDHVANTVHHFGVPGHHTKLLIMAEAVVDVQPVPRLPERLGPGGWDAVDREVREGDFFDRLQPSHFAKSSPLLRELARDLRVSRDEDPLDLLRRLNSELYGWFDYVPQSTRVDSPIDDALQARKGVCQDFAHVMIALVRLVGIPCRYVSGYLFHGAGDADRSSDGATHAWAEAFLPGLGWVGFDPTNNLVAGERHIRTAVGRDYRDVPPTKGVFKGTAESNLSVVVRVVPSDSLPPLDEELAATEDWSVFHEPEPPPDLQQQQQQQQ